MSKFIRILESLAPGLLILVSVASAELPGSEKSGQVVLSNKCKEKIFVACESYVDASGIKQNLAKPKLVVWTLNPGQEGALSVGKSRIVARAISFVVVTSDAKKGVSDWKSTDSDFDAKGRIFIQINDESHLQRIAKQEQATMKEILNKKPIADVELYNSYMERRMVEIGRSPPLSEQEKQKRREQMKQQANRNVSAEEFFSRPENRHMLQPPLGTNSVAVPGESDSRLASANRALKGVTGKDAQGHLLNYLEGRIKSHEEGKNAIAANREEIGKSGYQPGAGVKSIYGSAAILNIDGRGWEGVIWEKLDNQRYLIKIHKTKPNCEYQSGKTYQFFSSEFQPY